MAVIINATTTTGLTTSADNSGVIQFQSNGANTVGISSTGYITIGGNQQIYGPSFSAYRATAQTGATSATFTKIQLNNEYFDTNSNFDSTTNYRFTPTVAGYYQVNATLYISGTGLTGAGCFIYKNASLYVYGHFTNAAGGAITSVASATIYFNGTTDYIELYGLGTVSSGTVSFGSDATLCQFSASMVRGA